MNTTPYLAPTPQRPTELLCCSFNQDQGCFVIGYENGFRVYNSCPLELKVKREFTDGGIGIAQMLYRTNYVALSGGGRNPKFPENKLIIWDDLKARQALSLEFKSPILKTLLSRTRIIVVLKNKVHVYAFSSPPSRIVAYDTVDNPHGIAALAENTLAFPGPSEGQIQIVNLAGPASADGITPRNLVSIVRAHKGPIRCLCLNEQGSIVASASEMGTIVRLHSTANTSLLHEFRRGLDRAIIYSIAFSRSSAKLAILSDKNTLHVFDTTLITAGANEQPDSPSSGVQTPVNSSYTQVPGVVNRRHVLGSWPLMPKYFSSEWSFVSCKVEGKEGVIGWAAEDTIIVVWQGDSRWEKYLILEKEVNGGGGADAIEWELVREAWRAFEGLRDGIR